MSVRKCELELIHHVASTHLLLNKTVAAFILQPPFYLLVPIHQPKINGILFKESLYERIFPLCDVLDDFYTQCLKEYCQVVTIMGITNNEALSIEAMNQTKVIAGQNGLDKEIKWVNVIEVLDAISALQEGELLITTAFGLADSPGLLAELVPYLAKRNLAGLAIQTGYYLDVIPPSIIEQCNTYNLPLLELPKHTVFSEITMAITKRIINRQMEMLEYAQRIHDRLTLVILHDKGLAQVAKVLAELISAPVRILDAKFQLLTYSGLEENSSNLIAERLQTEYLNLKKLTAYGKSLPLLINSTPSLPCQFLQPLIVGDEIYGYISVFTSKITLGDMEKIAISSAATISTLEILKEKAIRETEERIKGDFIDDLLENSIKTNVILHRRATYLGFNIEKNFVMLSFHIDNLHTLHSNASEEHFQEIQRKLFTLVRFYFQSYQKQALLKYKNNNLVVLLQVDHDATKKKLNQIAEQLRKAIKLETPITVSIGIGRIYKELSDMPKSYLEAEHALSIGRRLRKSDTIILYEDLGPYNLFVNLINERELQEYYLSTAASLIDYDTIHKSQLASTLETLFLCNNELKETAKELYIHRHTLKYRLHRIHEITGLNPENAQDQFQLQLGLIAARLLSKL